jgi:glycosyltransferase involved in cell wall biosynthesis
MINLLHIGICTGNDGFAQALRNVSNYTEIPTNTPNLNEEIIKQGANNRGLVFIQIQSHGIYPETIQTLRDQGNFVINWTGDVRHTIPDWMHNFGADLTCFSNMNDVDSFHHNSDFLQIGYNPDIFKKEGLKTPNNPEIVFMGNSFNNQFPLSGFRREMVHFLKDNYVNKFGVYGGGWPFPSGNFNGNQIGESQVYRSAKIAINCSHFDYRRYTSDRMFRILGSGCFCLTKWFPEIETDFEDGKHLVVWRTLSELKEKIDYYLANEKERKAIANSGHQYALNTYTFDNQAENIIKLYDKWK